MAEYKDFKQQLYDEIIRVANEETILNTTEGLSCHGGYEYVIHQGIPYVINQTSLEVFEWHREEVVPVSEEYNQETPSVNATDRSDYVCQYQFMFRLQKASIMKQALNELRDYFFTNKQFTLGDYTVGIKVTRGNKRSSWKEGGNIYARYTIDVYVTATKHGYIVKDADIWEMRRADIVVATGIVEDKSYEIISVGTTDFTAIGAADNSVGTVFTASGAGTGTGTVKEAYKTLKIIEEATALQGNTIFSNATNTGKGINTAKTGSSKLRVAYESDELTKHLYSVAMNKEAINQLYDIKHTFDGVPYTYENSIITTATRRIVIGGTVILDVDWVVKDA